VSRGVACVAALGLVLCARSARAHDRTTSYSAWTITGRRATVRVLMTELDASHFPWWSRPDARLRLGRYLTDTLRLRAGDVPCPVTDGPHPVEDQPGRIAVEWRVDCPPDGTLSVRSDVLYDVAPGHLHFARLVRDGSAPLERVLVADDRTWTLPEAGATATGTSFAGYVALGLEHILTGYDHLAFVVALILIGGSVGEVARVVTGFTVAHSITLGLAVLGYVRPSPAPIEALVGLSIALVAAENIWLVGARTVAVPALVAGTLAMLAGAAAAGYGRVPALVLAGLALFSACYFGLLARATRKTSLRWAVAFLFGLVHGFAFASVLIEAQLDTGRLVRALFGFNLGVELGQLGVVALVWPVLVRATRGREHARVTVIEVGSACVLVLGVFLFVSRAYR
jgi:HupE/UreJ protein